MIYMNTSEGLTQVAEELAKYYIDNDYAMDEHYGSAEIDIMEFFAGRLLYGADYDYIWDKAMDINHAIMDQQIGAGDVEKYNYWYKKLCLDVA